MDNYLTTDGLKFLEIAKKNRLKKYADAMSGTVTIDIDELTEDLKNGLVNMLIELKDDNMSIVKYDDVIVLGAIE